MKPITTKTAYAAIISLELQKAQSGVLSSVKLTEEAYGRMMFEMGCDFAANFSKLYPNCETVYEVLMYNKELGFWNWWKLKWKLDDGALIKVGCISEFEYRDMKETLLNDGMLQKELEYMIKPLL